MKIYKCDKCGKQIPEPKKIVINGFQSDPVIKMLQNTEFCASCRANLYEVIDDYVTYRS